MKCPNCGNEIIGKFCTSCGTPAPVEETVKAQETQPVQSESFGAENYNSEPVQPSNADENNAQPSNFGTDNYNTQPSNFGTDNYNAQPNNFGADNYNTQPSNFGADNYNAQPSNFGADNYNAQPSNFGADNYNAQPSNFGADNYNTQPNNFGTDNYNNAQPFDYAGTSTPSNGMPVNNGYTGQQFTNVPNNNMPNQPKKGMSGGKIAGIVIGIIAGILLILAIIIIVVACNAVKNIGNDIMDGVSAYVSNMDDGNSSYNYSNSSDSDYSGEEQYDESTSCYYKVINGNEISIEGVNMYDYVTDYDTKYIEVKLPEKIDGKTVTDLANSYVYNPTYNDAKDVQIKVIVPGTVKTVHMYAFLDCESLTEIVFEDGVQEIEEEAVVECNDIKKITVPESVTTIGTESLGFVSSDGESFDYTPVKDLVIVAKKGSTAEKFAKDNGIKVENN